MFDSSLSSPRTYTIPVSVLRMSALVKKLRALRGWSRIELALRAGVSLADVSVVEDCRQTTHNNYDKRIARLTDAFQVPLVDLNRRRTPTVLPFRPATTLAPIPVNSFIVSEPLVVHAVEVYSPTLSQLTISQMHNLVGRSFRPGIYHDLQRAHATASKMPRGHLWRKYQAVVQRADRDQTASVDYTVPTRDDPQTIITRRATATKIGQGLFEIATDVVGCAAVGVTACDGSPYCTCAACSESAVRQYLAEVGIDAQRYA